MKFSSIRIIAAFMFLVVAFLFSCQKENNVSSNTTTEISAQDAANYSDESAQADGSFDDIEDISLVATDAESTASIGGRIDHLYHPDFSALRSVIGNCATITVSPNDSTYPKTITIDFGDSCTGLDGKLRSGKIVINVTAPLRKAGSVMTITLDNFYINHIHIEGTKTITNLTENGTIQFSVVISGGKVTLPSGRGYSYESSKTKIQVAGMATASCLDDVYQITGWATIVRNNGPVIKFEIVDPVIKKVICPWRSDGTLKISINDRVLKLDYGFPHNGDCDNKALLTWNDGNSQRVVLLP